VETDNLQWVDMGAMSVSALFVAMLALWVAWDIRRKTTQHIVRIERVASSPEEDRRLHTKPFHEFTIDIANLGLAFPEMVVLLRFRPGPKEITCPLTRIDILTNRSTGLVVPVAAGQIVRFGWRTYELPERAPRMLSQLESLHDHLRDQEVWLSVYCSGFHTRSFRVLTRRDRIIQSTARVLLRGARALRLGRHVDDQKDWLARIPLIRSPRSLASHLDVFLSCLRAEQKNARINA